MKVKNALLLGAALIAFYSHTTPVNSSDPRVTLEDTMENMMKSINQFHAFIICEEFESARKDNVREACEQKEFGFFFQQAQKLALLFQKTDEVSSTQRQKEEFLGRLPLYEGKMSYQYLIESCFYTSLLITKEVQKGISDSIHRPIKELIEDFSSTPNYVYSDFRDGFARNIALFSVPWVSKRFYPFILIGNNAFPKEVFLYALSKRIYLLSLPYKECPNIHGGLYKISAVVLNHDNGHLNNFKQWRQGTFPFFWDAPLSDEALQRKIDIFEAAGGYFYQLLQQLPKGSQDYKRVREVGFTLTHEGWTRSPEFKDPDQPVKDHIKNLIHTQKESFIRDFLPDELTSEATYLAALPKSKELEKQIQKKMSSQSPKEGPDFRGRLKKGAGFRGRLKTLPTQQRPLTLDYVNLDQVEFENIKYDYTPKGVKVTYTMQISEGDKMESVTNTFTEQVSYDFSKKLRADWVPSLKSAGYNVDHLYIGPDKKVDYDVKGTRQVHLEMLDWFLEKYL